MTFTTDQKAALSAPLAASAVKEREQAGRRLSYIEGWHALAEANRIFGFDAWDTETVDIRVVAEAGRKIGKGQYQRDGWGVSYVARVRVKVGNIVREGVGAGHGIDADLGLAHESAIKEAETDARKRALMTFGNPFGLALYDKEQRNVADEPRRADPPPAAVEAFPGPSQEAQKLAREFLHCATKADVLSLKNQPEMRGFFDRANKVDKRWIADAANAAEARAA